MGLLSFVGKLLGLQGTPNQKIELTKSATAAGLPIIYGRRRVDAITVLKRVSNQAAPTIGNGSAVVVSRGPDNRPDPLDHNNWLHRIDVWGQGPIEAIEHFWIDGDLDGHKRFKSNRPYFRAASMLGSLDQTTLAGLSAAASQWGANHRGQGVAYSWTRFFNSSKYPQYRAEPALRAQIKGLKLYDPRQDTAHGGVGTQDFSSDANWSFSNNRALVVLNYLMSAHGLAAGEAELDMQSFIDAANVCDQQVNIPSVVTNQSGSAIPDWYNWFTGERITIDIDDVYPTYRPLQSGSQQNRYEADAVIDPKDDVVRNLERLLEEFGWSLSWSNGRHRLVIEDGSSTPVMTIAEDDILGGWSLERGSRSQRFNRVTVEFPNANKNYEDDTVSWPERSSADFSAFKAEDGGRELHTNVSLSTVTDFYRAKAYAEFHVRRSRVGERIKGLRLAPRALLLEPGDVVALDFAAKGLSAPGDTFLVERISVTGTLEVSADLVRYDASIYGAETPENEPLGPNDDNLDPFVDPGAISNLNAVEYHTNKADGSVVSGIYLTWDKPVTNVPVERIEVQWRDTTDTALIASDDYAGVLILPPEATACRIDGLADDQTYEIKIRYYTRLQHQSVEATHVVDLSATVVSKLSTIEASATDGATIGTNLYDQDGFLVDSGELVTADGQLTLGHMWDFKWSDLGWTSANMTVTGVPNGLHVTPLTNDGQLISPDNLTIDGSVYDKIAVRMKRVVAGQGDFFEFPIMFYETATHGFSDSYKRTRSLRFGDENARTFVFDMANLTSGGDDWVTNSIKRLRFDPSTTVADTFEIDWIGVGRVSAPAQEAIAANLADEIQFADIAPLDTDTLEVFGKVEMDDTGLNVGDQVSVGCEILALGNRRGRLEIIFELADTSDIAAYTSQYVNANMASYQRATVEGLVIPPGTKLIRYRLLREPGLVGAVGGRRPSLNKGAQAIDWYPVRGDVEQGANNTTGTSQLVDDANLGLNNTTYGATAPSNPQEGDIWVVTGSVPLVINLRVSGVWQNVANLSTGTLANEDITSFVAGGVVGTTTLKNGTSTTDIDVRGVVSSVGKTAQPVFLQYMPMVKTNVGSTEELQVKFQKFMLSAPLTPIDIETRNFIVKDDEYPAPISFTYSATSDIDDIHSFGILISAVDATYDVNFEAAQFNVWQNSR